MCLEQGADCMQMVQLTALPPKTPSTLASFKSRLVLPFWYKQQVNDATLKEIKDFAFTLLHQHSHDISAPYMHKQSTPKIIKGGIKSNAGGPGVGWACSHRNASTI